jgi:FADH2 O2-dependent halogenase
LNASPLSVNAITNVGLTIEPRFSSSIQVSEQFKDANTARPWISSDRLQHFWRQTLGQRYWLCRMFQDFYSCGLFSTIEVTETLLNPTLAEFGNNISDEQAFREVDAEQRLVVDYNDDLVESNSRAQVPCARLFLEKDS